MLRIPLTTLNTVTVASATADSTSTIVIPTNDWDGLLFKLLVTDISGGTSPTLDVYVQTTLDGGSNWLDVCHFTQITATTSNPVFIQVPQDRNAVIGAVGDATIGSGALGVPVLSKSMRIKYVLGGSPSSVSFTVAVIAPQESGVGYRG